jgi:hypothetical protein
VAIELTGTLVETVAKLITAGDISDVLHRVVQLAVNSIDGSDAACVCVGRGSELASGGARGARCDDRSVVVAAFTDPIAERIEAAQHDVGEGPCIEAHCRGGGIGRGMVYAEDIDAIRWPRFSAVAEGSGMRAVMSVRLAPVGPDGSLNLYSSIPGAFGVVDRARAVILASLVGVALSGTPAAKSTNQGSTNQGSTNEGSAIGACAVLTTHAVLVQAKQTLVEREKLDAVLAFDVLRRASRQLTRSVGDMFSE